MQYNIVDELQAKGVEIISIREQLDTTTPQGRFILTVFTGLAELKCGTLWERQREGKQTAQRTI
ncbi:MAG: recombinase family protein [Oscillospiraceae bacterium]|nr:recombinase family protein [Oscillospiraceae bacterium]